MFGEHNLGEAPGQPAETSAWGGKPEHSGERQKCRGEGRGNCATNSSHRDFTSL